MSQFTEDDLRAMALLGADEMVEAVREANFRLNAETGRISGTTEDDYQGARAKIERVLLGLAGLAPRG